MTHERRLRGLTWGHRRAIAPLQAAARAFAADHPGCIVDWDVQPLDGFEHGLSGELADTHDLIVFDHPFCGDIARHGWFQPMPAALAELPEAAFVGPSLASYRYDNVLWGVPIDGATQTAIYRPDLLARYADAPPRTWDEVIRLGRAVRADGRWLGMAMRNPHGFLVLAALCANLGAPLATDRNSRPVDRPTLQHALDLLRALRPFLHPGCIAENAIGLHEAMVAEDDIVYCPAAYAYLTYAEADQRIPLKFAPFPGPVEPHHAGTVLGGTGLGITRSCRDMALAVEFAAFASTASTQLMNFATHHGQPARIEAWADVATDARFGGAFSATRATVEAAWIRPRFEGSIRLQAGVGEVLASPASFDATDLIERRIRALHGPGND